MTAIELVVYPTDSSSYQDELPLLGNYLPQPEWATVDPTRQGATSAGFYNGADTNGTGHWRDVVVTYVFGSERRLGTSYGRHIIRQLPRASHST